MSDNNEKQSMYRHSMSHVLAKAIKELYGKETKLAIGPAVDNGFYYDFDMEKSISSDDYANIEAKMKEIINSGATTILVSHSLNQVRSMCNKILWLHKGKQITFGSDVKKICDDYQAFLDGKLKI